MKSIHNILLTSTFLIFMTVGCEERDQDGPPTIKVGESICVECGMILSDERFATVTVIEGPRGPEPRIFDDFNCQVVYENKHSEDTIVGRWSHDHDSVKWFPTEQAAFVLSAKIRSPMGSQIAAFQNHTRAAEFCQSVSGEELDHAMLLKYVTSGSN